MPVIAFGTLINFGFSFIKRVCVPAWPAPRCDRPRARRLRVRYPGFAGSLINWAASKAVVLLGLQSRMSRDAVGRSAHDNRPKVAPTCASMADLCGHKRWAISSPGGCPVPERLAGRNACSRSTLLLITEDPTRAAQVQWLNAVRAGHGSARRGGETVLPHSSKLSSPLVEPVAYPWRFSYATVSSNTARACPRPTSRQTATT